MIIAIMGLLLVLCVILDSADKKCKKKGKWSFGDEKNW